MNRSILSALALLSVPALASFPAVDEIAFSPVEGLRLTTTFDQVTSFSLVDQSTELTVGGEAQDAADMEIGLELDQSEHKVWTDTFEALEDGQTTILKRTFDELSSESVTKFTPPGGEEDVTEDEGESELEGSTVVFKWDSEDEEYTVAFDEEEADGDEDLLEKLEFDAFLVGFLPEEDVSEGDTWDIDLEAFNQLSSPGGDLAIIEDDDEEEDDDDDFTNQFEENLEGTLQGEYKGVREIDGESYAVIFVTAELETEVEQESDFPEEGVEGTVVETYSFILELEGELLWNVKAGHAVSFTFAGDMEVVIEEESRFEVPQVGEIVAIDTRSMEGEIHIELSVE